LYTKAAALSACRYLSVSWVPQADLDTLNAAIATAETITANYGAGLSNSAVNGAATALNDAVLDFNSVCTSGTYIPGANLGLYVGASLNPEPAAGTTLASALAWLKDNATADTEYTVLLGDDETLPPWDLGDYGTNEAVELVLLCQKYASKWVFYSCFMVLSGDKIFKKGLIRQSQHSV
jgi:hypothetical protein